jgi:hypothetical protein
MTWVLLPPCPAEVSEVVPTVATGPLGQEVTTGAVRFTSLLTSFPHLKAMRGALWGRMKNFTPLSSLHSSQHPSRSPGDPVIGRVMARRQTCHDVQQDHSQAKSRTSGNAAGATKSVYAYLHPTGKGLAALHRNQLRARLEPLSAGAAIDEPDEQLITIKTSNKIGDLQNCARPQGGGHPASRRRHAATKPARQGSRQLNPYQLAAAAASAARSKGRQR